MWVTEEEEKVETGGARNFLFHGPQMKRFFQLLVEETKEVRKVESSQVPGNSYEVFFMKFLKKCFKKHPIAASSIASACIYVNQHQKCSH